MSFIVSITKLSNKLFIGKFVADFQGRKRLKNKVKIFIKAHENQIFIHKDHLMQPFFTSFDFSQDEKICENNAFEAF